MTTQPMISPIRTTACLTMLAALTISSACSTTTSSDAEWAATAQRPTAPVTADARPTPVAAPVATAGPGPMRTSGSVAEGPRRITDFRPASERVAVDAETVDLKKVFEDLGDDTALWYQHVQTLSNPYFEGRVNGSRGIERAREYMEFYFRLYGLQPAFPGSGEMLGGEANEAWVSYQQPFEFTVRQPTQLDIEGQHASIDGHPLRLDEDYVILGNAGSGSVTGHVTFVGYGIEDGPDDYSSFKPDTDLSGRIALLLRYEPLNADGLSRWASDRFTPQSGLARKMNAVQERGAAGIILVNPPDCRDGRTGLEPIERSRRFGRALEIPVIQISQEVANGLLIAGDSNRRGLMKWRRMADDASGTIVDLDDAVEVRFGAEIDRRRSTRDIPAANVGAVLPGRGSLVDEYLVIGGHYDHNGYGQFGTDPADGPLFPGADDNASGTAGILMLAKMLSEWYASADERDLRSVLFIAFDAEERGLHGSRHFANEPTVEPERMMALLNMDMIGRLRSNELSVLGTGTAVGLSDILRGHFESSGLTVRVTPAGSGRSDDANFDRMAVPAMHFFTGMHSEYTSPEDKAHTVNPAGAAKIINLMNAIARDFVTRPELLEHTKPGAIRGQNRGYAGVRLGIRPGMDETLETGILIEGISEGTSAAEAGLKSGDVMLTWDGETLDSMRTLVEKLRSHKPGDVVHISVKRDGREVDLPVTLKAAE